MNTLIWNYVAGVPGLIEDFRFPKTLHFCCSQFRTPERHIRQRRRSVVRIWIPVVDFAGTTQQTASTEEGHVDLTVAPA